jgi:hypothetical protein
MQFYKSVRDGSINPLPQVAGVTKFFLKKEPGIEMEKKLLRKTLNLRQTNYILCR